MTSTTSFSGISNFDSTALVKSLIDQDTALKITPLQTRLTTLEDQNTAFSELSSLLTTLKSKADTFRTINGSALSNSAGSSDQSVLQGSASNTAIQGTYQITATQLASTGTVSFGSSTTTYTSSSDTISAGTNFTDTISVAIGDPSSPFSTINVAVDQSTTLDQFVSNFNSQTSNATASVVNVGTEDAADYRVVIASKDTGVDKGTVTISGGSTLSSRGSFDSNTSVAAQNAIFSIDGIGTNLERDNNTISDVIQGVTFSLNDTGTATLSVGVDTSDSAKALKDFVSAYNDVHNYIAQQNTVTRDESGTDVTNIFGPLATTSLDDSIVSTLRSALTGNSSTGGGVNVLSDLGVTTNRDGTLAFDQDTFTSAVSNDPSGATRVLNRLGDTLANTNGTIDQFSGFGRLIDSAENSNNDEISRIDQQLDTNEKYISQQEQSLNQRYTSLQQLITQLDNTQSILSKILP